MVVGKRMCFRTPYILAKYMHNLMTLQKLNSPGITYDEIIYRLADKKYHRSYKEGAHYSLETMASTEPFVGEYIAPYIKR